MAPRAGGRPALTAEQSHALAQGQDLVVQIDPVRDLARSLTPRGHKQAERMAAWLNQRLPETTQVLVSLAQRTQQTALALGRSIQNGQRAGIGGGLGG